MSTLSRALAACRRVGRSPAEVTAMSDADRRLLFSRAGVPFGRRMAEELVEAVSLASTIDRVAATAQRLFAGIADE